MLIYLKLLQKLYFVVSMCWIIHKRKDGKVVDKYDFYKDPRGYESNFMPFAKATDYFIAGHFYGNNCTLLFY